MPDGKPLAITKVFDTLLVLVENRGEIVEKEELMKRLWPDTFGEEANLTFSVQRLRKSLGDNARKPHYIGTVPRRGYRLIADVEPVFKTNDWSAVRTTCTQRLSVLISAIPAMVSSSR